MVEMEIDVARRESRPRKAAALHSSKGMPSKGSVSRKPLSGSLGRPIVRRYLTQMTTTVSSEGQIVLPAELRRKDRIVAGQEFEIERVNRGEYRLVRRTATNDGVVDWLLACPAKRFFVDRASS